MKQPRVSVLLAAAVLGAGAVSCKYIAGKLVEYVDRWDNGVPKRQGTLADGVQSGAWEYYYESGKLRAKGRYEDDHQVGPWTYWYETGVKEWEGRFDENGARSGAWTFYHLDETVRAKGSFAADLEEGYWRFFDSNGRPEREGSFDEGKLSGLWLYFYPDGNLKARGVCHRGQRIGPWTLWSEGGGAGAAALEDYPLPAGVAIVRELWPNDSLKRVGVLKNGEPVGRWVSYHDNGVLRFACSFRDGRATGLFEARRDDDTVLAIGRLNGAEFAEGCFAYSASTSSGSGPREIVPGPMPQRPPASGEWSGPDLVSSQPAEAVVATWLAEARTTPESSTVITEPAASEAELPKADPALVAAAIQGPERIPAPMQPGWTVAEQEELDDYVLNYLEGPSRKRMSRKSYGPSSGRAGRAGPGERPELKGKPLPITTFTAVDGTVVDTTKLKGRKRILLVVLRGFVGEVCVYCVAQTEALAQCQQDFEDLDIEVLVVYPGPKENQLAFEKAYEQTFGRGGPPYKVFYDPDLELVNGLGISGDLAFPSTLITDKDGIVEYAFVGAHRADRPAAKQLLKLIEGMKK